MKKLFFLVFFSFLASQLCFSQFKLSAKTGILNTSLNELLWNKTGDDAQIISQLDWNTYIAPVLSLDTEYKLADTFIFGLNGLYTIPFSYGIIEDFDYLNILSTGGTERTHYSKHDNKLDNYWNAGTFLGVGGKISDNLKLYGLFSFSYSYYCFTALNGYRQYGTKIGEQNNEDVYNPWADDIPEKVMEGEIISFEAQKYFFGLGTRIEYNPSDVFSLIFCIKLMPAFITQALDTHYKRKGDSRYNLFDLNSELAFDAALLLEYRINRYNGLNAGFDFYASSSDGGRLYQSSNKNNWQKCLNSCGVKEMTWKFVIGYTYIYEK